MRLTRVWAFRSSASAALLALALAGCNQREKPSEIRLEFPRIVTSRDPVAVSLQAVSAQGATSSSTEGVEYAVAPPELASVKSGLVSCIRSGDGELSVSIAGVSRSVPVRCRIVARVEAASTGRVELTAGPFQPKVRVLDPTGAELKDVDVSYFSKNSGVVFPKDGQLVPKLVGTATIVARAGESSAELKVDVVRKVTNEVLPIEQNKKLYVSLEPGKYELKVKLPSPRRLVVEWRGAPYCNQTSEGTEHVSTCGLRAQGGGVVFDNPAYSTDGSKAPPLTGVELNEVP